MAEVARGGGGVFPGCVFCVGGVCWRRRRVWDEHYIYVGVEGWEIRSSMAGSFGGLACERGRYGVYGGFEGERSLRHEGGDSFSSIEVENGAFLVDTCMVRYAMEL